MKLKCCYCIGEDPPDLLTEAEVVYDGYSFCLEHLQKYIAEQAELVKKRQKQTAAERRRREEADAAARKVRDETTLAAKGVVPASPATPILPRTLSPGGVIHGPGTLPGPLANFTITPSGGIIQHVYDEGVSRAEIIRRIQEAMHS